MDNRNAYIYVNHIYAGLLQETDMGYCFTYDSGYLEKGYPAVSLTLPLQRDPYLSTVLFPFFDGLIPEGWLLDGQKKTLNRDTLFPESGKICRCIYPGKEKDA